MATIEKQISKSEIISALSQTPHGKNLIDAYMPIMRALVDDWEFVGHLIAWNRDRGQVKDAKMALPVLVAARWPRTEFPDFKESDAAQASLDNALAHMAMLDPRLFVRALDFSRTLTATLHKATDSPSMVNQRMLRRLVVRYLRNLEAMPPRWEAVVLQHRQSLKTLYARYHVKSERGSDILANRLAHYGGRLAVLHRLATAPVQEAAGLIVEHKIPFLTARGVMGARVKEPDIVLALLARMTATDVVTNMKTLERWGVKTVPALRAALEAALARVGESTKAATLKTTVAADVIEDPQLREKLRAAQEKQLDRQKGIDGNWLVLADKSGSMKDGIDKGRQVAGILARMVRGEVHLVFFDRSPRYVDATGKSYEDIGAITKGVQPDGGTSIGCGVVMATEKKLALDGIAIVSDGGEESHPDFCTSYAGYVKKMTVEPSIYFYQVGRLNNDVLSMNLKTAKLPHTTFDVRNVDYYSLPDVVKTMRVGHYGLVDEIWSTPLVTLDEVLSRTVGMAVIAGPRS